MGATQELAPRGAVREAPAPSPHSRLGPRGEGLVVVAESPVERGGVERIVDSLIDRWPAARLVAGWFEPRGGGGGAEPVAVSERVHHVRMGGRRRHFLGPLYARRIRSASLDGASVVITTGGIGWTAAASVPRGALHVGLIGGAPRPFYEHTRDYLLEYPRATRPLLRASLPALRAHHRRLGALPHRLATNSQSSARTLEAVTGRRSRVIHPPVRTELFTPSDAPRRHFLVVSRLVAHKRVELVIEAFRRLGEPLVIAGDGPWRERLRAIAPPNVTFAGEVGDAELVDLYRGSRAVVSASVEEFGICLAEAQSCGIPVVAPAAGGAAEIVRHGETGLLVAPVDADSIERAVRGLAAADIDPTACRRAAERFSEPRFWGEVEDLLDG